MSRFQKPSDEELRWKLSPDQYAVTQHEATEPLVKIGPIPPGAELHGTITAISAPDLMLDGKTTVVTDDKTSIVRETSRFPSLR